MITGALVSLAKLSATQHYKTAAIIEERLQQMGLRLTDEAIATWLKQIEDAIAARQS